MFIVNTCYQKRSPSGAEWLDSNLIGAFLSHKEEAVILLTLFLMLRGEEGSGNLTSFLDCFVLFEPNNRAY